MSAYQDPLENTFRALADGKRRTILMLLSQQDMTIGDITKQFTITRAAVKKHLTILEEGQLISVNTRGRERINSIEPQALQAISQWVNHFSQYWDKHLLQLQHAIDHSEDTTHD